MIGLLAMGTSCFALVWVMGRSRLPVPPARMRPFTGQTLLQFGGGPDTTRPGSRQGQAQIAGDDQALDLAGALADLQDLGVPVLPGDQGLVHEPVAPEHLGG